MLLVIPAVVLFVFGHLALLLSFLFGVDFISAYLSLTVILVLGIWAFFYYKPSFNLQTIPHFFLIVAAPLFFLISFVWFSQTLLPTAAGLQTGGGGMYGDTALHSAYTSILAAGKFPPQNPLFASETLVYPYASDLVSAILVNLGLSYNLAFSIPQVIFLAGFLYMLYLVCLEFGRKWIFLTTALVLFFGWGMGAFYFFKDGASLTQDYTNNIANNLHFHNILTGMIWPERTFIAGLFLGLLIFWLVLKYEKTNFNFYLLASGLILGALPFWHTHTFIFFSFFLLVYALWKFAKRRFSSFKDFILTGVLSFVMAIPFALLFFNSHSANGFFHFASGWQNGDENLISFWLRNSSFVIPLAVAGFFVLGRDKRIYFVPAFVAFLLANFVMFQPWDWDNIKILSWSFFFFSVLTAVFLDRLVRSGLAGKLTTVVLIVALISAGLLSVGLQLKNKYIAYDVQDIDLATWVKNNSQKTDVFLIEPNATHPVPGLTGRAAYVGYPGHLWVHGIDYSQREADAKKVIAGDYTYARSLEPAVAYIVLDRFKLQDARDFTIAYENQKYVVLRVN